MPQARPEQQPTTSQRGDSVAERTARLPINVQIRDVSAMMMPRDVVVVTSGSKAMALSVQQAWDLLQVLGELRHACTGASHECGCR